MRADRPTQRCRPTSCGSAGSSYRHERQSPPRRPNLRIEGVACTHAYALISTFTSSVDSDWPWCGRSWSVTSARTRALVTFRRR
jgi:hypothetical protein